MASTRNEQRKYDQPAASKVLIPHSASYSRTLLVLEAEAGTNLNSVAVLTERRPWSDLAQQDHQPLMRMA